jgi:hypothetical protein
MALNTFTQEEFCKAKVYLATQVATMMGRKLEEEDWSKVYCKAKNIPHKGWSNLHIDINHQGLGVEIKMLRIATLGNRPLKSICGTTQMHPAATRSIRIEDTHLDANEVMKDIFNQYEQLIQNRTNFVKTTTPKGSPDMRTGWLIWENNLREFLYFEEPMAIPQACDFVAEWSITPAKGMRKASKSLWIYEKTTQKKRYSVTTSAGVKIQPYFDIPGPLDENLYYFCVQGEEARSGAVIMWVAASTAKALKAVLGSLDQDIVSRAVERVMLNNQGNIISLSEDESLAVPIAIDKTVYQALLKEWEAVSDEHRAQLLLKSLETL